MSVGLSVGMSILQGQMAAYGAAQQGLNESRRIKAQNKARIKQMLDQNDLDTQNMHNNNVSINETKMKNSILIEESKLEAQDKFSQAFIGSGIKGRTKDLMAASLQNDVSKSHNDNTQQASDAKDKQFLGLMRGNAKMKSDIKNLESFDSSAAKSNASMAGMSAGLSSFASSFGDSEISEVKGMFT